MALCRIKTGRSITYNDVEAGLRCLSSETEIWTKFASQVEPEKLDYRCSQRQKFLQNDILVSLYVSLRVKPQSLFTSDLRIRELLKRLNIPIRFSYSCKICVIFFWYSSLKIVLIHKPMRPWYGIHYKNSQLKNKTERVNERVKCKPDKTQSK